MPTEEPRLVHVSFSESGASVVFQVAEGVFSIPVDYNFEEMKDHKAVQVARRKLKLLAATTEDS